ncbi:Transcriptional regulator, MarR family [Tritonibacter mobilis]|uniref:MarR family winged helix-turn-helix transcriptional regulator n=1 Tax=Alphaproteobacteria TaxID=28211 RepID=UPI0001B8B0C2|nr:MULTISPECIES: MarR family transcriptional regulator [Rhodobacterales]EEW58710.1 transcriptional regulator, MarR family [Ruegeria sp. TrichCH4B]MBW3241632.1 MarR family transcriptional regulator [Epibacterium sp. DP7N7-1]MCZ4266774.1 MarR family transcriptional regulator [Rhodobacteraceae bacterium G21628-S1]MBU3032868.1 MarR family transcriptional regulator [Tritonibacter mobilis]MCG7628772.1 MarR family transcriptional regulator [Epibacterium sp. MM17-32]
MDKNDDFIVQDFLPFLLNRAAEDSSLEFQKLYKGRYGMLRTEWRVLFHLGMYNRMTARDISQRAKIHKTKISRAVAKLAERRWVSRSRDESDRRAEHLELTAAGRGVYDDLRKQARAYDQKLTKGFSAGDVALLRRMLRQLASMECPVDLET